MLINNPSFAKSRYHIWRMRTPKFWIIYDNERSANTLKKIEEKKKKKLLPEDSSWPSLSIRVNTSPLMTPDSQRHLVILGGQIAPPPVYFICHAHKVEREVINDNWFNH